MQIRALMNVRLLIAAVAYFFCLETKETKIQDSANASFAARGLYPANHSAPQGGALMPRSHKPSLLHQANALSNNAGHHVLPNFIQKQTAVEEWRRFNQHHTSKSESVRLAKKRAGVDGNADSNRLRRIV